MEQAPDEISPLSSMLCLFSVFYYPNIANVIKHAKIGRVKTVDFQARIGRYVRVPFTARRLRFPRAKRQACFRGRLPKKYY